MTSYSKSIECEYMKFNPNDYQTGTKVHVKVDNGDILTQDFDGEIAGIRHIGQEFFVRVTADGDYDNAWDFSPNQLTIIPE